jgi:hypothetical protein
MPAELMYGAQFAKSFVNDYLTDDIPRRLIRYRNGWNLSEDELPSPAEYLTYEPVALDSWPTIITVAISTRSFNRVGYGIGADPVYKVNYSMRTYIWVRTDGSKETTEMRDRLTTVVRSALLDYPCLQREGAEREARIEETTVVEEFSDLTMLKGDRVLAGAYIGYDLSIDEVIARDNIADEVIEFGLTVGQNPLTALISNFTNAASISIGA